MLKPYLTRLAQGETLDAETAEQAFTALLSGTVDDAQIATFLTLLHQRGESPAEVLGAARALRAGMAGFAGAEDALDCVGTGGDGLATLNISTAVVLVLAGCGVRVAKHGNRAVSSRSGASDILAALGVNTAVPASTMQRALAQTNLCYLAAPLYHPAMRHVAAVRRQLGFRTIFNLLGPLVNPARVKHHLIGVYAEKWLHPFAVTVQQLGAVAAWVVHGGDGMDEITTTTTSQIVCLNRAGISQFTLTPPEPATASQLTGGDPAHNAAALRAMLGGQKGAYRTITLLNAAAGLVVAGVVPTLEAGLPIAAQAIDSGKALATLQAFISITNQ